MSKKTRTEKKEDELYPLPEYTPGDDIYKQEEETDIDPETGSKKTKDDEDPNLDDDLDIPGAELDDDDEAIGEEDEENNYYSLGGDNHEDLEEDKG